MLFDNRDDLEDIIWHDLEGARTSRDEYLAQIAKWRDEYEGKPYGNEVDGKSKIVWKLIRKQAESLASNIAKPFLGNYDIIQIDPVTEADVYKSKINEKLINHFWNKEFSPTKFIKELAKLLAQEGTAFIRVGWEYDFTENKIVIDAIPEDAKAKWQEMGATFKDIDGRIEITVRKPILNRPTAKLVKNEDIYVDPTADSFDEAKFVIYERTTSIGELQRDEVYSDEAISRLKQIINENDDTDSSGWDEHDYNLGDFEFKDTTRKKIILYEYWGMYDINGDDKEEPIYAVLARYGEKRVLMKMEENPFPFKKAPFVCIPLIDVPFKIYGESIASLISDEQKLSTSIIRGIIDNMAQSNNGQKFFKKNALDATNFNRLRRGEKYIEVNTTDSIQTAMMDGTFNPIPQNVFNILQMLDMQSESLTGVSKMLQGIPGSELKSSTSNFSTMMSQSQIRLLDIVTNVTYGLKNLFKMWLGMSIRYIDNKEIKRITGIDIEAVKQMETERLATQLGVQQLPLDTASKAMFMIAMEVEDMFNRSDLKYDIKLKVGTDGLKQIKVQNINMLIQQIGSLVSVGNVPPDAVKLLVADLAENLDRPDVAQMINEYQPQPNPIQQAQSELMLAKLRAEAEKDMALAKNAMARTEKALADAQKAKMSIEPEVQGKYIDNHKKAVEADTMQKETAIKATDSIIKGVNDAQKNRQANAQ